MSLAGGAGFGLGLARYLFELDPWRLGVLGTWPGVLAVAGLAAAAGLGLGRWLRLPTGAAVALGLPLLHALAPDVNPLRGITLVLGGLGLFGLLCFTSLNQGAKFTRYLPLALFLSLFVIYLNTLAPAVGEADTFEFQVGVARLGVAHGSGYPLLMLIGKVFSLLPLGGTLAWRANLTSAFFGALAGVGVERLVRRLGGGAVPAVLAGLAFGVSPTLWSRAVELEAYTLHAALVAALLWLGIDVAAPAHFRPRRLYLLAFLFGLSLANHLTTVLLLPALVWLVGWRAVHGWRRVKLERAMGDERRKTKDAAGSAWLRPRASARVLMYAGGFLLLGLAVYAYIPLRWPAVNEGERLTLAQFANILGGNEARGAFQWRLPFTDSGRYPIAGGKIAAEFGWPGIGLAALGAWHLARGGWRTLRRRDARSPESEPELPIAARRLAVGIALLLAYAAYLYFGLAFNVPDPDYSAFFIPIHLLTAVLMGLGVEPMMAWGRGWMGQTSGEGVRGGQREDEGRATKDGGGKPLLERSHAASGIVAPLLYSAVLLIPLYSIWTTLPRVDQSDDWEQQRLGEYMLSQPLAAGATVLADSRKIAPLYYLQAAEGRRPDLDMVVLPDEASYRAALDERLAAGQVVYLGRYLPGLGAGYSLRSVGPLAEVSPAPRLELPADLLAPAGQLAGPVRLLGYTVGVGGPPWRLAPPAALPLTLAWQARATPEEHWLVSLRLVGADGRVAWQSAGSVPVSGLYPTNAWRPGEVVTDFHSVPLAAHLAPGAYTLEVGLFLPFAAGTSGWAPVTQLEVLPAATPPSIPRPLRAQFGTAWLLGFDAPEAAAPGARVPVTLYWRRSGAADTLTAFGQERSLAAWPEGAVAPLVFDLTAPGEGEAWPIEVNTGTPARCGWLARPSAACRLGVVDLAGQAAEAGAINFGSQLLLNRATLVTRQAAPGGQVQVELEWQGLQRMAEDYTVFVHLLGPDGLVHGQVDAWPVSGTRPTSRWVPGERVADPYTVPLAVDAPPGEYTVEVGLYLLATGERLPVLNAEGAPVDDRVLLPGLVVE